MEVSAGTGERFGRKDGSGHGISKEEALSSRECRDYQRRFLGREQRIRGGSHTEFSSLKDCLVMDSKTPW